MNKLSWPTARVGLKEYDCRQVKAIILRKEDRFVTGLVLDEQEQQVVRSCHRLRFGRRVELEVDL